MSNGKPKKARKHPAMRALLIVLGVLRVLIFPALLLLGIFAGLHIGYVRFGGGNPDDVLQWETWKHVLDLVFSE